MDKIMSPDHRDRLIELFTEVAKTDLLTHADEFVIINVLENACKRASADLQEEMLRGLIEGKE